MARASGTRTAHTVSPATTSPRLHESGALTDEEFAAAKARALGV